MANFAAVGLMGWVTGKLCRTYQFKHRGLFLIRSRDGIFSAAVGCGGWGTGQTLLEQSVSYYRCVKPVSILLYTFFPCTWHPCGLWCLVPAVNCITWKLRHWWFQLIRRFDCASIALSQFSIMDEDIVGITPNPGLQSKVQIDPPSDVVLIFAMADFAL